MEVRRRKGPKFYDYNFHAQTKFMGDKSPFKVALCTRRSGKSYAAGLMLYREAYQTAGVSCLYLALTRDSAKRIMWKDVLKPINKNLELGAVFHENALTATLPNGSVIYLLGADSSEEEKAKILGQKFKIVIIDEAAQYSIDLYDLIFSVLKPTVADYRGTICMIGTPSNLRSGLFYELTKGQDPCSAGTWKANGWSGHRWSAFDNPYMKEQWKAEIEELKAMNPRVEETPIFQQNYLGRWVIDTSALVYRYLHGQNDFEKLPKELDDVKGRWHYVLGVDLGYNDPSAFVLCAYHDFSNVLYILEVFKKKEMDVTDVATKINDFRSRFDLDTIVIDGANKQAVEEMRKRHGLPLLASNKVGKSDFIELMNAEMTMGRVKLHVLDAQPLAEEYLTLVWDTRSTKREEHPGCENHCTDAALYAWRHAYAYLAMAAKKAIKYGSPEWYKEEVQRMEQAELDRLEEEAQQLIEDEIYG